VPLIKPEDEIVKHTAYMLSYNEKYEQANWVAYHLTAEMCDNNGEERKNNFREDQDVKTGSAIPDDYKKSGYDRGHLCPAGDMGWSEQTMSESFFMSNMSPQVPGFNRGIWKNLESNVRAWAKTNQEIYVVTAGVLEDNLAVIGQNKVAVPKYYYKIILDVHTPEYKAIAFVLPNEASKESVFHYAVSIDSVEHLTGINFFPMLPDSLENTLESKFDIDLWK
jgi:endonuclease G